VPLLKNNKKKINLAFTSALGALLTISSLQSVNAQSPENKARDFAPVIVPILNLLNSQCSVNALNISNATDDGNFDIEDNVTPNIRFIPNNTIDGNSDPLSRWSSNSGSPITFELARTSTVTDLSISWFGSERENRISFFNIETSSDGIVWQTVLSDGESVMTRDAGEFQAHDVIDSNARYVRIVGMGNSQNAFNSITEVVINGCNSLLSASSTSGSSSSSGGVDSNFGLDPNRQPWENFDLTDWALDTPADFATRRNTSRPFSADNGSLIPDGLADRTMDFDFASGTLIPGSAPFFYTADDGGMVFKATQEGFRTSLGTNFTRTELREMLRRGDRSINTSGVNENNWVLGYQPSDDELTLRSDANGIGGRNGRLSVTMRVNHVTTTGDRGQVGRVIIGQIHAEDDEPIRLYYRKFPEHDLGGIYFAHELHASLGRSDDILINLIGNTTSRSAANPSNGIALDELFTYEIVNEGANLTVTIRRGGINGEIIQSNASNVGEIEDSLQDVVNDINNLQANEVVEIIPIDPNSISNPLRLNMTGSGYDRNNEWMYFRAGAYSQNNTADSNDFDQVTIYSINNTHD